jgi:Taurine catabolism dioxygenase TauD, TfdA family
MEPSTFAGRRVSVPNDPQQFVKTRRLGASSLPLVVEPALPAVNLARWVSSQPAWIDRELQLHGAILFRGFECPSLERFEAVIAATARPAFDYTYRSTPRTVVQGAVFSSTEYPADQIIPMHNEMSYTTAWPRRLWFCCLQPALEGGSTPLADSAAVRRRIPDEIRARFLEHGVCYVRNYGTGLDLPWQEVFQTHEPAVVEAYCRAAGIEFQWDGGERLRTKQVCQSETLHPETGVPVWFNQAHLFHVSSLAPGVAAALESIAGEDDLPRNACFGDGSAIPGEMLAEVRAAYAAEMIQFDWHAGDVLLADNVLVAHGRMPFRGERRVVVGMTA